MKIFSSFAIAAMLLLSSCGSENTDARETVRPVDAWQPFVQVAPPGNIWNVHTNEIETHEEDGLFPRWLGWPTLMDQLENVTVSVQARNEQDFIISFHNDSNYTSLVATDLVLEAYMNDMWIPVFVDSISSIRHPSTDRLFFLELGTSELMINNEHFTRTFEGPYRVNVHIWHGDRSSPDFHRLTYVFSHGG